MHTAERWAIADTLAGRGVIVMGDFQLAIGTNDCMGITALDGIPRATIMEDQKERAAICLI